MGKYFIEDHPSDLIISAEGKDFCDLMTGIVEGLLSVIEEGRQGCVRKGIEVKISFLDYEDLLVSLLNELLFLIYHRSYIPFSCSYTHGKGEAIFKFSGLKCKKIKFSLEIKSATYHNLKLDLQGDIKKARILFDV